MITTIAWRSLVGPGLRRRGSTIPPVGTWNRTRLELTEVDVSPCANFRWSPPRSAVYLSPAGASAATGSAPGGSARPPRRGTSIGHDAREVTHGGGEVGKGGDEERAGDAQARRRLLEQRLHLVRGHGRLLSFTSLVPVPRRTGVARRRSTLRAPEAPRPDAARAWRSTPSRPRPPPPPPCAATAWGRGRRRARPPADRP